jgi:hypothetical protein
MLLTIALIVACFLVAAAATPLMLRLIPPNPIYGYPTRRRNTEPETWFLVNSFAGRALVIAAGVSAILLMMYNGTLLRSGWAQFFAFLIPMGAAVGATVWFERKTRTAPPREDD